MDSIRSNFYWQGADDKFKYHMLKWDAVTRPKDYGGLGIINTRIMNECLIVKWIWKIMTGDKSIWCRLLRAKYCKNGDFFSSRSVGSSQFWTGLHKVKHLFQWGAMYRVHKGVKVYFWTDVWLGNVPLKLVYLRLYNICLDNKAKVADYFSGDDWDIKLRRNLGEAEKAEWDQLLESLREVNLENEEDEVIWALEKNKPFSTKSLYRFLTNRGAISRSMNFVWKTKIPLKVKFFLWQMSNDRLQAASCLKEKGWKGSELCVLCKKRESVDHIFFSCPISRYAWCIIKHAFGWNRAPHSGRFLGELGIWQY